MNDPIERQDAIDALIEYGSGRAVYIGVEEAVRRIEQLPSAQPMVMAEWNKELKTAWECGEEMYVCPHCGRLVHMDMSFCGYCGIYLDKEKYCENCQEWNCDYCGRKSR